MDIRETNHVAPSVSQPRNSPLGIFRRTLKRLKGKPRDTVFCQQGGANEFGYHAYLDAQTVVGHHNYFGNFVTVSRATLGNYCSLGDRVVIGPGEHNLSAVSTSTLFQVGDIYTALTSKPCLIGSDVWIGTQAVVLRGVCVGHGAVIAANAVVTKDVPPYAIVAGVPARLIRMRFPEERVKELLASCWFDQDLDQAKELIARLTIA
ncbi:MAG: CatB-related O-acetyltransferase [Janthinobacterium lividum]